MILNIIQTITNVLDEKRNLVSSNTTEVYVISPEAGKAIQQISTGRIFTQSVNIGSKGKLKDYIEIDR